jgi:hypothetical protein
MKAFLYSHQAQPNTGIPGSGFNDYHPWLKASICKRRFDNVPGDTVFNAATRIKKFSFYENIAGRYFTQPDKWDITDDINNRVYYHSISYFLQYLIGILVK